MTASGSPATVDFGRVNFFKDRAVQDDPYPYFDWVRGQGPVWQEPHYGVYMVTGYEEALGVYGDPATFSSCNTISGPFVKFSVPLEGDDVSAIIDRYRDELPFSDQLPSFDPPKHTEHRGLTMRLITPKRLQENEAFMWTLADRQIDEFFEDLGCEFVGQYAAPFTLLVIADLEGVPASDRGSFREHLAGLPGQMSHKPLQFLYEQFTAYVEDRRRQPRDDVITGLATARFQDGSLPDVKDVALIAANLFVGGQETTVRMLSFALRMLCERPELQERLRRDPAHIPNFIEETLRLESPLRGQFRMARVRTRLGEVEIPAGGVVMLLPGACNRDPREFEDPHTFVLERPNARHHLAFGRGIHTCAGAPLARVEGRVSISRILERTSEVRLSPTRHGPPGERRFEYLPTYFLRGLAELHVEFTPAG